MDKLTKSKMQELGNYLEEIERLVSQLDMEFENTGFVERYPGDFGQNQEDSFDTIAYINYHLEVIERLSNLTSRYRSYETRNWFLRKFVPRIRKVLFRQTDYRYGRLFTAQEQLNEHVLEVLRFLKQNLIGQQINVEQLKRANHDVVNKLEDLEKRLEALDKRASDTDLELKDLKYPDLDFDYVSFEKEFRGSEDLIKERFSKYLKYFQGCKRVLDVGFGRGEFLDLCKENGVGAFGIDKNPYFCEYVKSKGHEVVCEDVCVYLKDGDELDGVFAAHILEHLTEGDMVRLIAKFYDALKEGSYFVIETPNVESSLALHETFYVDITHKRFLHPRLVEYLFRNAGFRETEILRIDYGRGQAEDFAVIGKK